MASKVDFIKVSEEAKKEIGDIFQKISSKSKEVFSGVMPEKKSRDNDKEEDGQEVKEPFMQEPEVEPEVKPDYEGILYSIMASTSKVESNLIELQSEVCRGNMTTADCARKIERIDIKPTDFTEINSALEKIGEDVEKTRLALEEFAAGDAVKFRRISETILDIDRNMSKSLDSIKSDVSVTLREHNYFAANLKTKINVLYVLNGITLAALIYIITLVM